MKKIAIMTDTNSGISPLTAKEMGVAVLPMPFMIDGRTYYENLDLTQEEFYIMLEGGAEISTSQPSPEAIMNMWDELLREHDQIVHLPMSSGLSGSCQTATMLSQEEKYEGRVFVVNNQRISVTLRASIVDALHLAKQGKDGSEIKEILEADKFHATIYIMLDTLHYLKQGGRITPAAAALGTLLRLKPVLTIQGEKLDAFAKARTTSQGKTMMISAVKADIEKRFGGLSPDNFTVYVAYTKDTDAAAQLKREVEEAFGVRNVIMDPLSLSVSCHIGPGALAVAAVKNLK
ncbi:MAG: DegV family protein [Lachnospiraceae bacterium]|nr:DegV family protein [Lachnospiraceae bacterium]